MRTVRALLMIGAVLVLTSVFLISTDMWEGVVVKPVQIAFGQTTADRVDEFGRLSEELARDILGSSEAARDALTQVEATGSDRTPEYRRAQFGEAWEDLDGNGCDTRNDILTRDLSDTVIDDRCRVLSGTLVDPYTGKTIEFVRGQDTSSAVQIDHVVPLAGAWAAGAWEWDYEKREQFANDPLNLIAVDGPTNTSKGHKGPAQWLPPNEAHHCDFAATYVAVTAKYALSLSDADRTVLDKVLASCEG